MKVNILYGPYNCMRSYVMEGVGYMYTCGIGHQPRYIYRTYVISICVIINSLKSIYYTYSIYHESGYSGNRNSYSSYVMDWMRYSMDACPCSPFASTRRRWRSDGGGEALGIVIYQPALVQQADEPSVL